ncbi:hypothetical protein FACS189413_10800 [Bacteroidia bacterium]|nr:hypothetical protein FACS189413_10800 [Bacteroidia bacterium]
MMKRKMIVSGVGCCLVDRLYSPVTFQSEIFKSYLSYQQGDGGLKPGQLVFKEEFERFAGKDFPAILQELTGNREAEKISVGGPCIVALIHAAQMTGDAAEFRFYGCRGNDDDGRFLVSEIQKTPVNIDYYSIENEDITASTVVLSDPDYDDGNGERIFINSIGASWKYSPEALNEDFFASDVVVFGGTALVPQIHDQLEELLIKAKSRGCFTILNTVYDFRNEKANPHQKWPLGKSDNSYRFIDLLITDSEEALRLSGKSDLAEAMNFFKQSGVGAVIITNGAKNIRLFSTGKRFAAIAETFMPVSEAVGQEIKRGVKGDTTGCGDNFAGGMIASVVEQLQQGKSVLDLQEACMLGVVSGGFACFYVGGTWIEQYPGEKRKQIHPYYKDYQQQLITHNL